MLNLFLRPFPNEHSARLQDPNKFNKDTYRRTKGGTIYGKIKVPATISIVWGKLKGKDKPSDKPIPQSLRFPTKNWTVDVAKKWLKKNKIKYIRFEPAKKSKRDDTSTTERENIIAFSEHTKLAPRDLTTRMYELRADSLDEKTRSIEAVIATENPVMVVDWKRFQIIEEVLLMSGYRAPANGQVPMLDTHDRSTVQKQLGSTRDLRTEGTELIGRNYYSQSPAAEHPWILTREGHLKHNSIGYKVENSVLIEPGDEAEVAGKMFKASPTKALRVTTEWVLKENSVCAIAADDAAMNRKEDVLQGKDKIMNEFEKWLEKRGLSTEDLSEEQLQALRKDYEAETKRLEAEAKSKTAPPPAEPSQQRTEQAQADDIDPEKVAAEAVRIERERVNTIRALGGDDVPAEVIERCISEGKSIEDANVIVLEEIRKARPAVGSPAIHIHDETMSRELLEDSLLLRAGFEDTILEDKQKGEQRADKAKRFSDMALIDVCRHALHMNGVTIPVGRDETIRAAFSTASLAILLGNVANKSLLKGYKAVAATWRLLCSIGNVSDFKEVTRARLTDTGDLELVGNSGEVKHGGAVEEYEKYSIATYAKQFAITRTNIINDDLNVFTKTPQRLGRRAALLISKLVFTHLLANGNMQDGIALFHATHKNLNTTAALDATNLGAALAAFRKQTDKDGQPVSVIPKYLTVPPELEMTALQLMESDSLLYLGWGGDTSTQKVKSTKNVIKGKLEVVTEERLSNANYTGYSATSWYVSGDPNDIDTIEVAFLNGKQTPTIEQFNPGPNVLGIIFRVLLDVGCKSLDFRGMQKNTA